MELFLKILVYTIIIGAFAFELYVSILNYKNRNQEIPIEVSDIYDNEKYQKWQNYYMDNFRMNIIVKTVSTIIIIILFASGFFNVVDKFSASFTTNVALQTIIFIAVFYLLTLLISLVPKYYQTFKIEEKYGFNKTTKLTFLFDSIKTIILELLIVCSIAYGLIMLYIHLQDLFIILAFLACVIGILLTQLLYVNLIVPLFNKLKPLEDGSLKTKIEAFAESVGYSIRKIRVIDASKRSTKLNAYFTGFGKFKKVVLYDTLINKCSEEEVVAVLAHEIGHNKHKHIWSGLIQSFIITGLYILALWFILKTPIFSKAFNFTDVSIGFSVILFFVLISPIMFPIRMLLMNISRKHEYQADAYAARNYDKTFMISSLKVLARENFSNLTPHSLFVKINYTHPPITDRIRAINNIE